MAREEEIRYLNMEIAQLKTQILVGRKRLPEQCHLQQDLDTAQIQLRECESELRSLELRVENAQDPSRVRLLPGPQLSQDELRAQLESLEERLATLEQAGLEKELLYEQVCRLVDRSKSRADTHKESTLEVAQKVSQYQSKIKHTTHKTMALVSELTMQQANALRLQHEVREKEGAVERAYLRLDAGQPPNDNIEQQWLHLLEDKQQLKDKALRMKLMSSENETISVEQRPNAYLPTGDNDLPIPKPYGNHAPFKPSPAGANMRHIRKPQPKPIDI